MKKNCDECIKNNRNPNAVGCIECSVVKNKKKKIRDLTNEEIEKICDKYRKKPEICCGCPLEVGEYSCLRCLDLDEEIEVEE